MIWELLKRTFSDYLEVKATRLGAALAYYTLFSIAPLIVVIVSIAGLAFGREATQGRIVQEISRVVGRQSAETIQAMVARFDHPTHGIIATIIGVVTILVGAIGFFSQLQDALNTIWQVVPRPGRGILGTVKEYLASFSMVLVIGFLLLVSLIISAALAALGEFMGDRLPIPEMVLHLINFVISFGFVTLLFAMIYKILPDAEIQWSDVWIGSAVTAFLFALGKFLIGLYLGKATVGSAYGTAGSVVVILVWVYYSSLILLFGAEFTQVYANRFGGKVVPKRHAISLVEKFRAQFRAADAGIRNGPLPPPPAQAGGGPAP